MAESVETAGRWTTHALRVMDSIFCGRRGDTKATWTNRILSAEWDASHGFPVEVVTSKLRTILETHHQRTSALGRIISLVWLGLLEQCPEEIETLKWLACQEYLLYRCHSGISDNFVNYWLSILCLRSHVRALPYVRTDLLARLEPLGEMFANDYRSLIDTPTDVLHEYDPAFSYLIVNSRIERATLLHLRRLEVTEISFQDALVTLGMRIKRRRDDLAAYRKQVDNVIQASSQLTNGENEDFDTIIEFLKSAQATEEDDMEVWRRLDVKRQSALITIEQLQNLLGLKKKANHNKNKNKNRAARKKELKQDKGAVSQGDTDDETETSEEPPFIQGCLGSGPLLWRQTA